MRKKLLMLCCGLALMGMLTGCMTNIHNIGTGAAGSNVTASRQWYLLFGLFPLNQVDSHAMAAGATNYQIQTQQDFLSGLVTVLTSSIISARTVTVTK